MYREGPSPPPIAVVVFGRHVFGLDRASGKRVWQWSAPAGMWSRLAIADGRVLVGGGHGLACLAYDTGALLWEASSPVFAGAAFVVDGDQLLLGAGGEVACISVTTGRLVWHEQFSGLGTGSVALGFPGNVAQVDH